jgi:uncharacterized protein YodC (DUF2158 family)
MFRSIIDPAFARAGAASMAADTDPGFSHSDVTAGMASTGITEPRFAVGDVVRLKSGGIAMTVYSTHDDIRCAWFDDRHQLQDRFFPADVLRREDEAKPDALAVKEDKAFEVGRNTGLNLAVVVAESAIRSLPVFAQLPCDRPYVDRGDAIEHVVAAILAQRRPE